MSARDSLSRLEKALAAAAAAYQSSAINPHCVECQKPCCRLDPLVLELDWRRLKALWQLDESRAAFDKRLASGKGPVEIREMDGIYYAHRKVCPAYDEAHRTCRVYGQELKPPGCTDFPVYTDQDCVIADLRCEALDLMALTDWLARAIGTMGTMGNMGNMGNKYRLVSSADEEFPFMITLSVA